MKWVIVLLLLPCAFGFLVETTSISAKNLAVYGDFVAYESNGDVHVYDSATKEDISFGEGTNPVLFAFTIAFERNGTIMYGDLKDRVAHSTNATGKHPSVYGSSIVFSTKESDLGVDFSNDGDLNDDVLRQFDVETGKLVNLKAIGDFPVVTSQAIVFLTKEAQIGVDLTANGALSDEVLRVFDREKRKVASLKATGTKPYVGRSEIGVFVDKGVIQLLDVVQQKITSTNLSGENPSIFDEVVVFERDGSLYGYSLNGSLAKLSVIGKTPIIFDDHMFLLSANKLAGGTSSDSQGAGFIRIAKNEDADQDGISDFIDNCPAFAGVGPDANGDGVGDLCEPIGAKFASEHVGNETTKILIARSAIPLKWFVLAGLVLVGLIVCAVRFGPGYYRRRKKSFGF